MIIDATTNTYKQHNEDAYGYGNKFAWVMDGALPLDQTNVTPWKNDVTWVGNWWTEYLNESLDDLKTSIHSHLEVGVHALNRAFSEFADIKKLNRASFCIGIIRINQYELECFILGDVEIAIKFKDGHVEIVTDSKIEAMDDEVIQMISQNKNREKDIVFNGYTAEELDILRRNRLTMNSKEGYYILEHDPEAIQHGIYKTYPLEEIESVLLMSDGFSAIYNKYDCCTIESLLDSVDRYGVDDIIHRIRRLEQKGFSTYKRLRKHDDATGVYCNLKDL